MTNTNLRSEGRFMSGMFFHVLPAQIILLLLTGINNIVDGLVGSNFFGPTAASVIGLYAPFQTIWVGTGVVLMPSRASIKFVWSTAITEELLSAA